MYSDSQRHHFRERVTSFRPDLFARERTMAIYSASIAFADPEAQTTILAQGGENGLTRESFYEIILQSHLFLGYPRMLIAAEIWSDHFGAGQVRGNCTAYTGEEGERWIHRGRALYDRVYGDNADRLQRRVESFAPEIFRWMIMEGYGKVLSRPGLDPMARELAIVACLTAENYQKQLFSHIRGALNTGAAADLIRTVIDDLGESAPGYTNACEILGRLTGEK